MSYINETDFVIENKKLVYPEIVADGLQLYYDSKGKRDTDYHRDTLLDMSGNKNHGKLHNFAYEKHSGYKDGLVFDYIDDKLVRPSLNLQPNDFTFMLNGNIISFSPDGTVKRVQDGEVIESKGFNFIRNGNFSNGTTGWSSINSTSTVSQNIISVTGNGSSASPLISQVVAGLNLASKYYVRSQVSVTSIGVLDMRLAIDGSTGGTETYAIVSNPIVHDWYDLSAVLTPNSDFTGNLDVKIRHTYSDSATASGKTLQAKNVIAIDLTATFGAGNEPTKEQMDEIINRFRFIPNAQDLIDHIEYKGNELGDMENIIDGLYKTEVLSGEEIYNDKADDNAVVHVDIDGKSVQGDDSNLFDIAGWLSTPDSEKPASTGVPYISIQLEPRTNYTVSTNIPNRGSWYDVFAMRGGEEASSASNGLSIDNPRTVLTNNDGMLQVAMRGSLNRESGYWIKVEKGEMETTFNGYATPTPDYPIEVHSLNDFDVVSSVSKRNLLPNSHFDEVNNLNGHKILYGKGGVEDSKLKISITTARVSTRVEKAFYLNETGTFTYSIYAKVNTQIQWRGHVGIKAETKYEPSQDDFAIYSFTFTNYEPGLKTIRGYFGNEIGDFIEIEWEKLEKDNKATDWAPALEEITEDTNHPLIDKINLLLDEPLRSVGDVKDILFRDTDGVWKIERNVGEAQIGASDITAISIGTSNNVATTRKIDNIKYYTSYGAPFRSTHHGRMKGNPASAWGNVENIGTATINAIGSIWLSVDKENINTVEKARNWFESQKTSGTPIIVQYALETPTIETLSQPLQDKLNNLRSFEDSNYVYTVLPSEDNYLSESLKPTLHAKFLYNNWYKEDRVINNLMIYNRALTNEEMLQNYKTIKRRWGM